MLLRLDAAIQLLGSEIVNVQPLLLPSNRSRHPHDDDPEKGRSV